MRVAPAAGTPSPPSHPNRGPADTCRGFLFAGRGGLINSAAVRHIRFLPLAFLAGVHGFDLFAPYAVAVLAGLPVLARLRRRARHRRALAPVSPLGDGTEMRAALAE